MAPVHSLLPKVALLFLAPLGPAHELLWRQFFDMAAQLAPPPVVDHLVSTMPTCLRSTLQSGPGYVLPTLHPPSPHSPAPGVKALWDIDDSLYPVDFTDECGAHVTVAAGQGSRPFLRDRGNGSTDRLAMPCQHLFSTYIHSAAALPENSLFYGRDALPMRANTSDSWGMPSLVLATQLLMAAALRDPRNVRFAIISSTTIPVQPPILIWAQLMAEEKSLVNACRRQILNETSERWIRHLNTSHLNESHMRKSPQVWDQMVGDMEENATIPQTYEESMLRVTQARAKVFDEHYIPIVLASYGLDNETDCAGNATWADWRKQAKHPATISKPKWFTRSLAMMVRGDYKSMGLPTMQNCTKYWPAALQSAMDVFTTAKLEAAKPNGLSGRRAVGLEGDKRKAHKLHKRQVKSMGRAVAWAKDMLGFRKKKPEHKRPTPKVLIEEEELVVQNVDAAVVDWVTAVLGYNKTRERCPLFARKFSGVFLGQAEGHPQPKNMTAALVSERAVLAWATDCDKGLGLDMNCPPLARLAGSDGGAQR